MIKVESFAHRHIGPNEVEKAAMLETIGASSLDQLIDETVPANIRMKGGLNLPEPMTEQQFMTHVKALASKNQLSKTYIGLGYHPTVVPGPIQRNILENPGWYTAYTPYQAEIAQGRLEGLLNFQTMVLELTGMEIANSSLLDEGTAAAEAMGLLFASRSRAQKKANASKFFVSIDCLPQTKALIETRATPLGIELIIADHKTFEFTADVFGALVQYPTADGKVESYESFVKQANAVDAKVAVAADIMSLVMLTPPGDWGADVVVGTTQRFGVSMGYGGPHAAFFATKDEYKRNLPGRIIGVSQDRDGNPALRMALQTREQHIKREKATSNICTAQALLAVMAGMYGVYHGPKGLKNIASRIHLMAGNLSREIKNLGFNQLNSQFFDTLKVDLVDVPVANVQRLATEQNVNFLYNEDNTIQISINETTDLVDLREIVSILAEAKSVMFDADLAFSQELHIDDSMLRSDDFMAQRVFNSYHSETDLMRYIKKLERKDLSLNHSMIPLGSCTMKLNAASQLFPLSWPSFSTIHPFVPVEQAAGYYQMFQELEESLCEITGFDAMSLQPNSGAQGEYAGLMVIRAFHHANGDLEISV
jgi:glycine dehydrogenase